MKVFIDTGVFIAYFIKQEVLHKKVVNQYKFYRKQKAAFLTSDYILDELLTWFAYNQNKPILEKLILNLERVEQAGEIKILEIDKTIRKKAAVILLKFSEHKISFTDATTYTLYKDFALDEIFTLDSDFKKIGTNTSF